MTIDEGIKLIEACADQMNDRYGQVVFDEFAVLSLAQNKGRVLAYVGPRNETFLSSFNKDLGSLRAALLDPNFGIGDFEFARHAVGTTFEAFMVLGNGLYLVCNNTSATMEQIAKNPRWLNAQIPFAELSEKVRANPITA